MLLNKRLSVLAGSMLAAGMMATSPVFSDSGSATSIDVADDRSGFVFFVDSADQVLATRIRVTGPNGYVFEDSNETGDLAWAADSNLPDGIYSWEAIAVTAPHSAPLKDPEPMMAKSAGAFDPQGGETTKAAEAPAELPSLLRLTPEQYKSVERKSGQFRMREGHAYPIDNIELGDNPQANAAQPNPLIRMADTAINLIFPEAHAQATADVSVSNTNPGVLFEDTSTGTGDDWRIRGLDDEFYIYDAENINYPFRIRKDAADGSLYISTLNRIGLGTATPNRSLHISDSAPAIRLEDTSDAASWYVRNTNESRFEINSGLGFDDPEGLPNSTSNPFTIETPSTAGQIANQDRALYVDANGNIGMGTDTPQRDLHIVGSHIRIEQNSSTWDLNPGSQGLWLNRDTPSNTFGIMKLQNGAPEDSIVATADGVGIGTDSPNDQLHVFSSSGNAGLLLEETQPSGTNTMLTMRHAGNPGFSLNNTSDAVEWQFRLGGSGSTEQFTINKVSQPGPEASFLSNGNLRIKGSLAEGSSSTIKHGIQVVSSAQILSTLNDLDIAEWRYDAAPNAKHIGPMAEDFYALFGFGSGPKTISPRDLAGVALAASKELSNRNSRLAEENESLKARLERLEEIVLNKQ